MFDLIPTFGVGIAASLIASLAAYLVKRRVTQETERFAREVEQVAKKSWEVGLSIGPLSVKRVLEHAPETVAGSSDLFRRMEEQVMARLAASSSLTKEDVQREIDQQVTELQKRLGKIEARFPEEAKLEKIASINDALLSERIDQLAKQVAGLENKILTKWDVALIVSTIIGAIGAVVGTTYALLKFFGKVP